MAKRKGREDESKKRHWAEVMTAWSESGLSQAAFCKEQGIPLSTFQYWRYQGRTADRKAAERQRDVSDPPFVPVTVRAAAPETPPVAVVLTNGRRIEVPAGVDVEWLAQVAAALEPGPC